MSRREIPEVARQLMQAKKRIENPENWCQGKFRNGNSYCAAGALGMTAGWYTSGPFIPSIKVLNAAARILYPEAIHIGQVNDSLGHDAVMRCFDLAISLAIQEANAK